MRWCEAKVIKKQFRAEWCRHLGNITECKTSLREDNSGRPQCNCLTEPQQPAANDRPFQLVAEGCYVTVGQVMTAGETQGTVAAWHSRG